jgi:hypothetical protein
MDAFLVRKDRPLAPRPAREQLAVAPVNRSTRRSMVWPIARLAKNLHAVDFERLYSMREGDLRVISGRRLGLRCPHVPPCITRASP